MYWLETIQYIGGNALNSQYKKYLFKILDLITALNPYFEAPYVIGEILIPSSNFRYENLNDAEQKSYIAQSEQIGLKGIAAFCDMAKVEKIKKENDLSKLWTDPQYKNPCTSKKIPFYLAFIYYFYKNDPIEASNYYKVTSAIDDTYEGAKIMAAIMQGKAGNRLTSTFMFLNLAQTVDKEDTACQAFVVDLENLSYGLFKKQVTLNGKIIQQLQKSRNQVLGKYDEEEEKTGFWDTKCSSYANKSVRELNLMYLENANEAYKRDHQGQTSLTPDELLAGKYIDFSPTDFQQYKAGYGIEYSYNVDTKKYDYSMGSPK